MSLGSGPMSPKRWRPWEQVGWGIGVAAGAVAPLCLWAFTLTWQVAHMAAASKPKADAGGMEPRRRAAAPLPPDGR